MPLRIDGADDETGATPSEANDEAGQSADARSVDPDDAAPSAEAQSSKLLAIADRLARPLLRSKRLDDTSEKSVAAEGDAPAMPPAAHLVVPADEADHDGLRSTQSREHLAEANDGTPDPMGDGKVAADAWAAERGGNGDNRRKGRAKGEKRRRANTGLVLGATLLAASLAVAGVILFQPTVDYRARAACGTPEPVVTLATQSKYDQSDVRKASLGEEARPRELVLEPVRRTVLSIIDGAVAGGEARHCARVSLVAWAQNGALTDMRTKDAHLTRSRLVAEMALAAVALDEADALSPRERRIVSRWGERVARDTVRFFADGAGPTSRRNNHRYWAALAVGAVGAFAERPELAAWARESAGIGLCSVDERGLLPLELGRGERALHYHLYALRPLAALKRLDRSVDGLEMACAEALPRLARATRAMLVDPSRMEAITGVAQLSPPRESAYGPLLRLDRAALNRLSAPALRGTIARLDDGSE